MWESDGSHIIKNNSAMFLILGMYVGMDKQNQIKCKLKQNLQNLPRVIYAIDWESQTLF